MATGLGGPSTLLDSGPRGRRRRRLGSPSVLPPETIGSQRGHFSKVPEGSKGLRFRSPEKGTEQEGMHEVINYGRDEGRKEKGETHRH